jgi:hypothetical protein
LCAVVSENAYLKKLENWTAFLGRTISGIHNKCRMRSLGI